MASIRALCHNGVLLENGSVKYMGVIDDVVSEYQRTSQQYITQSIKNRTDRKGNGKLRLKDVVFRDRNDQVIDRVSIGDSFIISVYLENRGWTANDEIDELSVGINDEYGQRNIVINNQFLGKSICVSASEKEKRVE